MQNRIFLPTYMYLPYFPGIGERKQMWTNIFLHPVVYFAYLNLYTVSKSVHVKKA